MSKRILVVDDVVINRLLAIALLKREGWVVAEIPFQPEMRGWTTL